MASVDYHSTKRFPYVKFLIVAAVSIFYYQIMSGWLDSYRTGLVIMVAFGAMMLIKHLADKLMFGKFKMTDSRNDRMYRYGVYSLLLMLSFLVSGLFNSWSLTVIVIGTIMVLSLLGRDIAFAKSETYGYLFMAIQLVVAVGMTLFALTHPLIGVGLIALMIYDTVRYMRLRRHVMVDSDSVVNMTTMVVACIVWFLVVVFCATVVIATIYVHPIVYAFMLT